MAEPSLTQLLEAVREGREGASDRLLECVYQDLLNVARRQFRREAPGHTLQPTALVSEAWMRLTGHEEDFLTRGHFFGAAAQAMRRILIDHARWSHAAKRGGGGARQTLMDVEGVDRGLSVIEVDDALSALQKEDPGLAELVELKFFAGLTISEIGQLKDLSPSTVKRQWTYARAWLLERMGGED